MVKAMLWKEWRENLKWAALAFFIITLEMANVAYGTLTSPPHEPNFDIFHGHEPITLLMAPLFVGMLGWLQVSGELKRDRWAFLIHRPASRTTLFWGKLLGGLSLYCLAFMMPFILLAIWASCQRTVTIPSQWSTLLDPLSTLLQVADIYFVGMLIALRHGRNFLSRYLPILAVIVLSSLTLLLHQEWKESVLQIGIAIVLGIAAWGSFLTDGNYTRQPRFAKVCLGLVLYAGLVADVAIVAAPFVFSKLTHGEVKGLHLKYSQEVSIEMGEPKPSHTLPTAPPFYLHPACILATPSLAAIYALESHAETNDSQSWHDLQTLVVSTLAVGFLYSVAAFMVAKRARLSRGTIFGWCAGTILLGLPGVLLLLCLREWPLLETCTECGQQRSINHEECEHCNVFWPQPVQDATAIYETAPAALVA